MNILSIGDACLETIVSKSDSITECERCSAGITDIVGGSGAIFALEAKRYFFDVDLICKLADDNAGQFVRDSLLKNGIPITYFENIPKTDRIIYVSESTNKRNMLVDIQSKNCIIDLLKFNPKKSYDACHISGYLLEAKGQIQSIYNIRKNGWLRDTLTLLDIVPHDIYLTHTWNQVKDMMKLADIIIIELRTAAILLGVSYLGRNELDIALEVDKRIDNEVKGLILRFGYGNCDTEWIRYNHEREIRETGYRQAKSIRGYGDLLTIDFLQKKLR